MIIVNQDKTEIYNFNEIFKLYVYDCFYIRAEKSSDNMISDFLGKYETEERAKEVLQEIAEKICEGSNIKMDIEANNCEVSKQIYYMPER